MKPGAFGGRLAALAFASLAACEETPAPVSTPSSHAASTEAHAPVWADRTKQAPFERGRAHLGAIRAAVTSPGLSSTRASELGFECASLRAEQSAVAKEPDPIVRRFVADVDRTCGLDAPLAAAYAEIRAIEAERSSGASVKGDCLGLEVALGDFAPQYTSNPAVARVGGRYATLCTPP